MDEKISFAQNNQHVQMELLSYADAQNCIWKLVRRRDMVQVSESEERKDEESSETVLELENSAHPSCSSCEHPNDKENSQSYKTEEENVHQPDEKDCREVNDSLHDGEDAEDSGGTNTHALEQKLYKLQEELTEMHKKRGENAQQIIDLNALLQEKEKEIQHKDAMISDARNNNIALKQTKKTLETALLELEATNQMLKDEHQALQMAFTALEEKYRKAQEDNSDLIQRWMEQKAKDADRMNAENADFIKARQQRLARDLEEAAKEQVPIDVSKSSGEGFTPVVCIAASIPTRAQHKLDAHDGEVYSCQWSNSGTFFATGGADRKIKIWDYHAGMCESKGTLVGSNGGITSLDFTSDDSFIVGASNDFASRVWTVVDQRLRHTLTGHSGKVLSAKFLSESKIVSGSHDRTLKIWDLQSKACIKTIFAGSSCNDLVTLYGTSIISGHFDRRVRFWDTRGADSSTNELLLQGRLTSLYLAPDKTQLLCCTRDDCLKIIDLRMNQVSATLAGEGFKVGWDSCRAVFSPDVEYAAAGSSDGHLYVWNIAKGRVEKVLKEHSHVVTTCSWSPTGTSIVSCERVKKVVVWSDY